MLTQVSSAIFDKILKGQITAYAWTILSIGMLSVFIPLHLLIYDVLVCTCKLKHSQMDEQHIDEDYDDMRTKFLNEYDRSNPVTKDQALAEYFQFIKSNPQ